MSNFIYDIHTYFNHLKNISDPLYNLIFNKSNFILLVVDPESGQIIDANNEACRFYGYNYNTLTFLNINQINIMNNDYIKQHIKNIINNGKDTFETKHKLSNGIIKDVEISSYLINYNKKDYIVSIINDISEKRFIESNLEMAYEELYQVFNNTIDLMVIIDINRRVFRVNNSYASFLKKDPKDIIGSHCEDVCPIMPCNDKEKCYIDLSLKGEKVYNIEVSTVINGKEYFFLMSTIPIYYKENLIVGVLQTLHNITEDKKRLQKLEAKEQKLTKLINQIKGTHKKYYKIYKYSPNPIVIHEEGVILMINEACLRLFKIKKTSDIIGHNILEFVHDDGIDKAMKSLKKYNEFENEEFKVVDKEGNIEYVEVTKKLLYDDDKLLSCLFIHKIPKVMLKNKHLINYL